MAETTTTTNPGNPPAPGGGQAASIDPAALAAALGPAIGAAVANALKPLNDQIAQLQGGGGGQGAGAGATTTRQQPGGGAAATDKPLTRAELEQLLSQRDQQQAQANKVNAAKERYAAGKMQDLPPLYRNALPDTDDPGQLAAAEQRLRAEYRQHLATSGVKLPDVGGGQGDRPDTRKPGDTVDVSKLSPMQLIQKGLAEATTTGADGAAGAGVRTAVTPPAQPPPAGGGTSPPAAPPT